MELAKRLVRGFERVFGQGDPTLNTTLESYVREGNTPLPPGGSLLTWDANSVKSFVFDTTNASAIRGASDLLKGLDDLFDPRRPAQNDARLREAGLAPEQILYAGGGSGLAVVATERCEAVARRFHELYAERTRVATCTVAWVDLVAGEEDFASRVRAVNRELLRRRAVCSHGADPPVPFFVRRCEICGRRAAEGEVGRLAEKRFECAPCRQNIDHSKKTFGDTRNDFESVADPSQHLAVVYLDGNGVGQTMRNLKSPLRFAEVSAVLSAIYVDAFLTLARQYGLEEETPGGKGKGTYQLPIAGGDDLVAILPGDVAVPLTRDLLREVERCADRHPALRNLPDGEPLGAAAGIAIGQLGFPIHHLLAEAEELLKSAKKRVYRDKVRGALDFAVVTDGSPRCESRPEIQELSGKPYEIGDFETFSRRFEVVRKAGPQLGKTQLYTLRRVADLGPQQLRSHVLYQVGRQEEWRNLIDALGGPKSHRDPKHCMAQMNPQYGDRQVFDVGDMLELYDHWREAPQATQGAPITEGAA